ncbi:hypothetical protein FB451DRAFT_1229723 [Mycena latifolia]|nr:hypothetical protein FB451DRAFT_1229723 [Mycena latifolia]
MQYVALLWYKCGLNEYPREKNCEKSGALIDHLLPFAFEPFLTVFCVVLDLGLVSLVFPFPFALFLLLVVLAPACVFSFAAAAAAATNCRRGEVRVIRRSAGGMVSMRVLGSFFQ